jgi:hypothetical protein
MKYLIQYNTFSPINEALGLAEPTLIYTEFLADKFKEKFDEWYLKRTQAGSLRKETTKESVSTTDLASIISNSIWPKFPVSTMNITYEFEFITDEEFAKKFPITSKSQGHVSFGACYNIMDKKEKGSYVQDPIDDRTESTIHIEIELGVVIRESFEDEELLIVETESLITHELNHAYENWNRSLKGSPSLSTDVTWSLEANRSKIKKEIFKEWYSKVGYYLYWTESHEQRAMVQEAWPYVKKFKYDDMKKVCPVWRNLDSMEIFNASEFKSHMVKVITDTYPDADPELMLRRIKSSFANQLIESRKASVLEAEDKPSISGEEVHRMSVDKFLSFVQKRVNLAADKMKRKIRSLYSLHGSRK